MAEITFDGLNENSLIMQWNTDNYGNPKSIHINNEVQQVSATHHIIQLAQIPDEYYRARFVAEGINGWLIEVRSLRELKNINNYYVDYNHGIVYFHEEMAGRLVRADYYGRGVMFLSDARIFHKSGDSFATTLDEVLEKSEDAFKLLESTGGLNQAIELLEDKAEEGNKVADRLENFITETQFYGYTIVLSREAFVVRAKEDGNLHNGEMEDLTVDVVVYKGAKNLSAPDLDVRLYSTTNCECEIENQKLTVTRIDVDCIQAQAIIEIDCGDGLIAYRTIEVTKVFDGVSQFNVEMTNAFHSFSATHSGKIEEEQSVTCEFTVTKANEEFKGYVVGIQNVPSGITHNLEKPTENASSVTFTAQPGISLPDNASISIVFQFNDYVITKTFAFTKSKQGLSAKSLRLAGNQIIHYENPNYEGTPNPTRTSIVAQVTDLSGTPVWSYLEGEEWIVIDGQNGTNLNLYHNDRIWGTKHELTIKCELDGFSDEITLIKIANGAMGLSSYSVILSNESTTLRVGLDGKIPTEELTSQYTRVTAFKGADQITPTSITVPQGDTYEVSVSGSTINLIDVDTSTSTVNIPIEILLDNAVIINKVWSIAKTEKGEIGAAGAVYSINVEGGTRAITYNQLNENPRPTFSGVFTAHIYENGNDITSQIKSWYWTTQGHFIGTSIDSSFTPEIKDRFDESVLNNSVTVTAIYNHMPISYTVPIVVSKDLGGLDWVTDWDSTKVSIKDTEVLTPRLFAGEYNPNSDTINGVAIGTDVLNDGQVQGITGYQNNKVSFLLATDGSLLIGNPFEDNGTGLSYNHGRFVLNVDEMAIAGGTVPTWDDMEIQLEHHSKDIINVIQDNIDSMNETLNDMTTFVDTILQDELITTLEKVQLDALFQTVTQEVNNIQAQYDSVINNPYLTDEDVSNLEKCHVDYMNAYSNIVDVYNDVFGEPVVEEVEYTVPQEEYLMANDFSLETVDVVDSDEVLDVDMEEQPVMLADEDVDLNPFMLDTLITQDGYIIVTKNGQPIQMVTENTLIDFSHAVDILREYSSILQQAISEALLSISENRASQMVEEAKEQVRAEIADVDSALNDLETTMNGSFKSGLIGEQSKAILNERLTQLSIEKKDVDGQYEVLSQNTVLSSDNKQTLGIAKDELDAAHDLLVSKINQVIVDNLITNAELQAVNNLISEYANKLQAYSRVAQECNALIAQTYANAAVAAITDEDVFNKVTNYGVLQGLFLKDEKVYINSEYINTRNFKAVTDDGKETFKIDENGEVSITAKSLAITGSSNLATQDYVNTQIENLTNTNITFTLSNEFQIIPTDESYYPLSEGTYSIKVTGYKGSSEEVTDFTIGTVISNDAGIIPVVSNINKTIVLSVSPDAPLGDSNGYVDIPISYDGRDFNKRWSWAVSKQGNQATTITITGEQFFKYTNNYTGTPTPSQIKVTANVFNSTETGKWQYDSNGTWVDCGVTDKVLTLSPTQYTLSSLRRVTLRYYVDSVFDTFTVACISDGANGTNGTNGTNGKDGEDGEDGKSVIAITEQYYLSTSQQTLIGGSWQDTAPTWTQGSYIWTKTTFTYSDNTSIETSPICVTGKDGADGLNGGVSVSNVDVFYYQSTSATQLTDGSWSTNAPAWVSGKYVWTKTITYLDNDTSYESDAVCITGEKGQDGINGANGEDGTSYYFYVRYSANSNGSNMTTTPQSDSEYMGVCSTTSSTAPTNASDYDWTLIKGADGQDGSAGTNGEDGKTSYLHIKYSDDGTIFTSNNGETLGKWIGTYVDYTEADSTTFGDYTWKKFVGEDGQDGTNGSDAYTVLLSNENHTFVANHLGVTAEQIVTTDVIAYKGSTPITPTIGTLPSVTGLTLAKSGVRITIKSNTGTSLEDNGSFDIPITVDGQTFTKTFSWTKVKDGQDGEAGASAKSVNIVASNMVFKSTDGGAIFTPDTIKLTAQYQNLTHSRWQYSIDGGTTWMNVYDGDNGGWQGDITATSDNLTITIPKTCTFFTDTTTSIVFKAISTDESFYDVVTITKLYDVADVDFEGIAEEIAQEQIKTYDTSLNQQYIFNRLTDNGKTQGIYLEDGQLYINGEYINTKNFKAVNDKGNQTFLIDSSGNVHINANTFSVSGNSVPTTEDVMNMIDSYGQSENLLLTPNFNSGSLSPNWGWSVSSFVYVDTTYKHNGNTACRLKGSAGAINLNTRHVSTNILKIGQAYQLSMWVYCESTSSVGEYDLNLYGTPSGSTSSTLVGAIRFSGNNLVANEWTQIKGEIVPEQECTAPTITVNGVSGSIDAWVTDFELKEKGESLSQQQLVTILNGAGQGFYLVDGKALINAEYIQTGTLAADLIQVRVDGTTNLLPFNYITMDNAMNTDAFTISTHGEIPHMETNIPIYSGGGSTDILCTPIGYSHVKLRKGKSYWFSCEVMAQWDNDTKLEDGRGTSTVGGGSKAGIGTQTGNNLDLFLYDRTDNTKINTGRNLLDNTSCANTYKYITMFSAGEPAISGFSAVVTAEDSYDYGNLMLVCSDTSVENYYRFMPPVNSQMYGMEAGCTYTLSGLICGTMSSITIRHQYHVNGGSWTNDNLDNKEIQITSTDEWKPFSFTFTIPPYAVGYYLSFQNYNNPQNSICYLAHLKLEKSPAATPWCLSPADQGITLDNPHNIESSYVAPILASMRDFNASIDIEERYEGSYIRTWTRLTGRVDATYDYEGNLWINLDGTGFSVGSYAYFYIQNLQLVDASQNDETIQLDYIQQLKEKRIELTDGSYFTNLVGVDGIKLTEGVISGETEVGNRYFKINYDGYKFASSTGSEHSFMGLGKSYYSYWAGSTGIIDGYDDLYGVGCMKMIGGDDQGIFIGVHEGFQIPNGQGYGRADIYRRSSYSDSTAMDDWTDWELLGEKIEPLGLVRRDDNCNITTNDRIYFTGTSPTIDVNGVQGYFVVNGTQYGNVKLDLYTGSSIEIWADSDYSTTTEMVWIGAGGNAITITSSGTGQSNTNVRYNSKIMYHEGYQQTSTSDIRYKRAVSDVSTEDCYDMVKNTTLHNYLLLDDVNELHSCSEDGIDELETELDIGYSRKVQMGIIAQDVLKYECGKYFVVQDIVKDDDGNITSDKYSIDAYNYASAILGGLQEEIKVRDEQYEELKKENEDLKARLEKLEQIILKGE